MLGERAAVGEVARRPDEDLPLDVASRQEFVTSGDRRHSGTMERVLGMASAAFDLDHGFAGGNVPWGN